MPHILEKRRLLKMNLDDELRTLPNGECRYFLNCRVGSSDDNNQGDIENVKGNVVVSFNLPAGTNKCIGTYEYITSGKIYYFVWNSGNNHLILEYDEVLQSISTVLKSSVLNFDRDYLITGINVIEGLLYWTDDLNEPMKIDIVKGKLHSQGNFTLGYPNPFLVDFIYQIKPPQLCQPTVEYGSDATKRVNYLENKLFDFKIRYYFDNNEKSVPSSISVVAYPDTTCGGGAQRNNYIKVTVDTGSEIVKKIEVLGRECGSQNIGDFYSVQILDKAELSIASNTTYDYLFYNDRNYLHIDVDESIQLYDNVPIKSKAQEIIDGNRLVHGNVLEGYDPVDMIGDLQLGFEDTVNVATVDISGRIFITNPFAVDYSCGYSQPIHDDYGNGTICFGGFDETGGLFGGIGTTKNVATGTPLNYSQILPLGGFTAYLAGTDYYDTSVQNTAPGVPISSIGSNSQYNVYSSGGTPNQKAIVSAMQTFTSTPQVYSTFTIRNVPYGTYILRFAGHKITSADFAGRKYQRTSTYTQSVGGTGSSEVVITIGVSGAVVNGVNTPIVNNTVTIPQSYIADLTNNGDSTGSNDGVTCVNDGYVIDKDSGGTTPQQLFDDTRIHMAQLQFNNGQTTGYNSALALGVATNKWNITGSNKTFTDHNGFFFYAFDLRSKQQVAVQVTVETGNNLRALGVGDSFFTESGAGVIVMTTSAGTGSYFLRNVSPSTGPTSVQQFGRTLIKGIATQQVTGVPQQGVNVQITRGGSGETGTQGDFAIIVYGDHTSPNSGYSRSCYTIFSSSGICFATFTANFINSSFNLPPQDNISNFIVLANPTTQVNFASNTEIGLKRGATYYYGWVYYDHGFRNGLTQTNEYPYNSLTQKNGFRIDIPFYTEKDASGNIIGKGKPVVAWGLANKPPIWATHFQAVRATRQAIGEYTQWAVNTVKYTDSQGSTSGITFQNASRVVINIYNISADTTVKGYKFQNPDSVITYTFTQGDRVRLIKHVGGAFYNDYYDLKIKGTEPTLILSLVAENNTGAGQILPGDLIELYSPTLNTNEHIYYEMGECFEVGNAGTSSRYHKMGNTGNTIPISTSTGNPFKVQDQDISKTWRFSDNQYSSYVGFVGNLAFIGVGIHNYSVGDVILISQDNGWTNGAYNTFATVVLVPSANILVTDQPFLLNSPLNPGFIYSPATGVFNGGDTFFKLRSIPYTPANPTTSSITTANKLWYIEDKNFSDFYVSDCYDKGRPNKIDKNYRQIRKPVTIDYSGVFVKGTLINDINRFYDTAFEDYIYDWGSIQKFNVNLQSRRLECYQELRVGEIPVNDQTLYDTNGQVVGTVGQATLVLGKIIPYAGEYGIGKVPESFAKWGFRRYFVDPNRGVALRLSSDGLTAISEHNFKAHNFFTDQCLAMKGSGIRYKIYGVYDQRFTEYVIAFERIDIAPDEPGRPHYIVPAQTLSFNEDENVWASFYSYEPDFMVSNNTDIVTFKGGKLWRHNENPIYNNFYGTQYHSEAHVPINSNPSKEKTFEAISLESEYVWEAVIDCPNGQQTNLVLSDFEKKLNMQYADLWNDVNTPNVADPLINGDKLQDTTALIKLTNSDTSFRKLYAINCLYVTDERSDK